MDAFKEALMKKLMSVKGAGAMGAGDEMAEEQEEKIGDDTEMAPTLEAGSGQASLDGDAQVDPEVLKVLEALSDRASLGRPAGSLGERAAAGAKEKLMAIKGKK